MDADLATWFLQNLHATSPKDEWLSGWCIDHDTGRKWTLWATVGEAEELVSQILALTGRISSFVGVSTRQHRLFDGRRGGRSDCAHIPGLWVDIDVAGPNHAQNEHLPPDLDAAYELLRDYPEDPSVVIETGGGLQAYWLFDAAHAVDAEIDLALAEWTVTWEGMAAARGWKIDNVWDVPRIMRLPGSVNNKILNAPVPVEVVRELKSRSKS